MKKLLFLSLLLVGLFSCTPEEVTPDNKNPEFYPHKFTYNRVEYTPNAVSYKRLSATELERIDKVEKETVYDDLTIGEFDDFDPELNKYYFKFQDESNYAFFKVGSDSDSIELKYAVDTDRLNLMDESSKLFYSFAFDEKKTELLSTTVVIEYVRPSTTLGLRSATKIDIDDVDKYLLTDDFVQKIPFGHIFTVKIYDTYMKLDD